METTIKAEPGPAPRIPCEDVKPRMAKVEIAVRTIRDERAAYGQILRRASELAGMNRDQTAEALHAEPAQVSRWWSGDENAQVWRYHRHPRLRAALRLAEALTDETVHVETVIRQRA